MEKKKEEQTNEHTPNVLLQWSIQSYSTSLPLRQCTTPSACVKRSSSDLQMSVLTDVRSVDMRVVYSAKVDQTIIDEGVDDDEAIKYWSENDCQREKRGTNHIFMYLLIGTMTHHAIRLPLLIWRSRHDSFEWINRIFLSNECTLCIVKTETRKGEKNTQNYLYRWKSTDTRLFRSLQYIVMSFSLFLLSF